MIAPRPCHASFAVARALSLVDKGGQYVLGTGNYKPQGVVDLPWSARESDGLIGCDCAGLIVWAYKVPRHRLGYNHGGGYDVEDDLNCNSMLGDAMGAHDLFTLAEGMPQPGDVIAYPSFYLYDSYGRPLLSDGKPMHWIGHTCIVVSSGRVGSWDPAHPRHDLLDVVQVRGPDRRAPAAIQTDGSIWMHHDETWPKPQHRSYLLRAVA